MNRDPSSWIPHAPGALTRLEVCRNRIVRPQQINVEAWRVCYRIVRPLFAGDFGIRPFDLIENRLIVRQIQQQFAGAIFPHTTLDQRRYNLCVAGIRQGTKFAAAAQIRSAHKSGSRMENQLVVAFVRGLDQIPIAEEPAEFEFVETGCNLLLNAGRRFEVLKTKQGAQIRVLFLDLLIFAAGVEPDLEKRHQCLGDVELEAFVGIVIYRKGVAVVQVFQLPFAEPRRNSPPPRYRLPSPLRRQPSAERHEKGRGRTSSGRQNKPLPGTQCL